MGQEPERGRDRRQRRLEPIRRQRVRVPRCDGPRDPPAVARRRRRTRPPRRTTGPHHRLPRRRGDGPRAGQDRRRRSEAPGHRSDLLRPLLGRRHRLRVRRGPSRSDVRPLAGPGAQSQPDRRPRPSRVRRGRLAGRVAALVASVARASTVAWTTCAEARGRWDGCSGAHGELRELPHYLLPDGVLEGHSVDRTRRARGGLSRRVHGFQPGAEHDGRQHRCVASAGARHRVHRSRVAPGTPSRGARASRGTLHLAGVLGPGHLGRAARGRGAGTRLRGPGPRPAPPRPGSGPDVSRAGRLPGEGGPRELRAAGQRPRPPASRYSNRPSDHLRRLPTRDLRADRWCGRAGPSAGRRRSHRRRRPRAGVDRAVSSARSARAGAGGRNRRPGQLPRRGADARCPDPGARARDRVQWGCV